MAIHKKYRPTLQELIVHSSREQTYIKIMREKNESLFVPVARARKERDGIMRTYD